MACVRPWWLVILRGDCGGVCGWRVVFAGRGAGGGVAKPGVGWFGGERWDGVGRASAQRAEGRLERWGGRVAVAAVNGPASVVVSGDRQVLGELLELCSAEDVRAREIPVGYASHSPQIEEIREELLGACAGIAPRSCDVPFFSTVTGGLLDTAELDGEYWYRNLRETVQFDGATRSMLTQGHRAFIEAQPAPRIDGWGPGNRR